MFTINITPLVYKNNNTFLLLLLLVVVIIIISHPDQNYLFASFKKYVVIWINSGSSNNIKIIRFSLDDMHLVPSRFANIDPS